MTKTFTHKLGTSRAGAGTRIWLEGKRLSAHGFTHRMPFTRIWHEGKLVLRVCDAETWEAQERSWRGTVAGSVDRPIIDITGEMVAKAFTSGTVNVTYSANRIVITEA
jgi:hypothetical protein